MIEFYLGFYKFLKYGILEIVSESQKKECSWGSQFKFYMHDSQQKRVSILQ